MSETQKIADITADIEALVVDAYQRGLADGSRTAMERIVQAAVALGQSGSQPAMQRTVEPASPRVTATVPDKVPNGTIRPIVSQVLDQCPGLSTAEVGRRACDVDPRVTPASIANELNRNTAIAVAKTGRGQVLYIKVGTGWHLAGRLPATADGHEVVPDASSEAQYEKDPEAVAPRSHMNGTASEAPVVRLRAV